MSWQCASALTIGDCEEQQDRVAIFHLEDGVAHLLVVADGMGGHEDGAAAAQTVIDIASSRFNQKVTDDPRAFLESVCLDAHNAILTLSDNCTSAPGSTCVIAYLTDKQAYCVHIGDSRLYQFNGGRLIHKTSDHSIAQLMEEHDGDLKDGTSHSVPQNQLYMCLGGKNELTPEFYASRVSAGDFFVLCSDGFWNQVDVEELFAKTDGTAIDQDYAGQLVQRASQQADGKSDNICLAWAYREIDPAEGRKPGFLKQLIAWFS
jgi:serine/threonine protein phosphatase PrpC